MAQDDDQRRTQNAHAELDGPEHFGASDVPGGADHEQVAQTAVEEQR